MRSPFIYDLLLTLLMPITSALITGIQAPDIIAPNTTICIKILTANYIQTVDDISMAFGLSFQPAVPANQSVGTYLLGSTYLGPDKSNVKGNITTSVKIPAGIEGGDAIINGALYSLIGARYFPIVRTFTAHIMVGNETSERFVDST